MPSTADAFDRFDIILSTRHNNQLTISGSPLTGRNVTLRRLVAEAQDVQINQAAGPRWLDENE